jgi:hypothetical protein
MQKATRSLYGSALKDVCRKRGDCRKTWNERIVPISVYYRVRARVRCRLRIDQARIAAAMKHAHSSGIYARVTGAGCKFKRRKDRYGLLANAKTRACPVIYGGALQRNKRDAANFTTLWA